MPQTSSDENYWDDDQEGTVTPENDKFKQLRNHARDLEKARKASEKELEELRAFKADAEAKTRTAQVREIVASLGLPPKVGNLYSGEPTPEGVADWVKEYGDVFGVVATSEVEETGSFTPTATGAPPSLRYTYKQYRELLNSDPEKAIAAVQDGRVEGMYKMPSNPIQ